MDHRLLDALAKGLELRDPSQGLTFPIDFVLVGERGTLVFRADWWQKESAAGVGVVHVNAVPRVVEGGIWTFDHQAGYVLAPPSDEDQERALQDMRKRTQFGNFDYLRALQLRASMEPDYDFRPWLDTVMASRVGPDELLALSAHETKERAIGKILLRDGRGTVVDSLVVDEGGFAATADEDGHLVRYADQWTGYTAVDRPTLNEFVQWLATQQVYGDFEFDGAGVVSASGDVQEIALRMAAE